MVDAVRVRVLDNYQLFLQLEDGATGVFDVAPYLDKGVFPNCVTSMYFVLPVLRAVLLRGRVELI